MINNNDKREKSKIKESTDNKKPNENGGFCFSTHIKIYDPNTKQVMLKKRGE